MRASLPLPLLAVALTLGCLPLSANAQTKLLGAGEVLRRTMPEGGEAATITGEAYRQALERYRQKRAGYPPIENARQWFELHLLRRRVEPGEWSSVDPLDELFPGPDSWPTLATLLRENAKGTGIAAQIDRLLAAFLVDDVAQQYAISDALMTRPRSEEMPTPSYTLHALRIQAAQRLGDPRKIAHAANYQGEEDPRPYRVIPDLVEIQGAQKAEPLLRKEILAATQEVIIAGPATKAMARRIALQEISRFKGPKWYLIDSAHDLALYEAMAKRFPNASREIRRTVDIHAFFGYILQGRKDRAVAIAARGGDLDNADVAADLTAVRQAGKYPLLQATLAEVVNRQPQSDYFDLALVANLGTPVATKLVNRLRAAYDTEKRPDARIKLRTRLKKALLQTGRVDEAVAWERKHPDASTSRTLVRLGRLLNKPNLIREGLAVSTKPKRGDDEFPDPSFSMNSLILLKPLIEAKEWALAEKILLPELKAGGDSATLIHLAGIYHRAGRPQDVRLLLDRASTWGSDDLAPFIATTDAGDLSLGAIAGSALVATGERERGIEVLRATVRARLVDDEASRALVDAQGDEAIPLLTKLSEVDRFEERPVIWIAYAHLKAGRLKEAETTIRKAISIDPSDGEQPHGRRMVAYAILADILKAKGDSEGEKTMRGVVAAIRLAERADDELEAGLLSLSTQTYRRSLTLFSDAYCIQSRLAIQLAQQGRFEEAETHYRRAYELMPDSFGRVESHCFGCEGAFTGERVQKIAENVFMRLVQEQPTKPQVHYLMGYLRSSQGNSRAALPYYRQAVALDPDYLNAWKNLRETAASLPGNEADVRRADLALGRLDPLGRHTENLSNSLQDRVTRAKAAIAGLPPVPQRLYPLPLSAKGSQSQAMRWTRWSYGGGRYTADEVIPEDMDEIIANDPLLGALLQFNRMTNFARRP